MVKKGKTRSDKFSAKHDPFVIMLRLKALQNPMKDKFSRNAFQQALIDSTVQQWSSAMSLPFGKSAVMFDLVKKYVWTIGTMSELELEAMYAEFSEKGFTDEQFTELETLMFSKYNEMHTLYSFCHRELSKIWSEAEFQEPLTFYPNLETDVTFNTYKADATKLESAVAWSV